MSYAYLYSWSFFFYGTLFRFPGLNFQTDITDGGDRLRQIMLSFVQPSVVSKDVSQDSLLLFFSYFLKYPVPTKEKDGYYLTTYMDFQSFSDVVSKGQFSDMNTAVGALLSNFFQEENLQVLLNGKTVYPDKSQYAITSSFALPTIPGQFSFKQSIFKENDGNPFGFSDWLRGDKKNPYDWGSSMNDYNSIYKGGNQVFFMPTFALKVRIVKWHPILVSYCAASGVLLPTADLCQQIYQQTGIQIEACNSCKTANKEDCKQKLPFYCSTVFTHPNAWVSSLLYQNTLNRVSIENQCQCYNSELPPPNMIVPGNPAAMCFNKYCSDSDLDLVGANDAFCKKNCRTVDEWVHPTDPSMVSKNPGALNVTRFDSLCGKYKTRKVNWNVLLNGLVVVGCGVGLCCFFKRRWVAVSVGVSLGLVLLGVVLFLSFDLVLSSYCTEDTSKPYLCETAITKIQVPRSFCDYRYCECLFDGDCPTGCICGSGKCIPLDYGVQKMATVKEMRVGCNIPLLISITVFAATYVVVMYRLWPRMTNKVRYPVLASCLLVTMTASVFLMIFKPVSVYSGSCVVNRVPLLGGTYLNTDTQVIITDDLQRKNLVFLCPANPDEGSVVLSNSNMYITQEKTIRLLTVSIPTHPDPATYRSYLYAPSSSTAKGSYLILSDGNFPDMQGWVMQHGVVSVTKDSSSVGGTVTFEHEFKQAPLVLVTPETTDRNAVPVVRVRTVDTKSFVFDVVAPQNKDWVPATTPFSVCWVALSQEENEAVPDAVIHESGTSPLRTVTYRAAYDKPPLVLLGLNTNDPNTIGIASLSERTENMFSWNVQTTTQKNPTSWSSDYSSITMQYLVIAME